MSVEVFVEVQLLRRSRAAGGLESRRKLERGPKAKTKRAYPLRGRVRCGYCGRRMEGTPRAARTYYRCSTRTLVPGSPLLVDHPKNVYLPEAAVLDPLNDWLNGLFARENRDATVRALLGANADRPEEDRVERAKHRADDAATRLRRLQRAIEAGAEPEALVEAINRAKEERDAALIELDRVPVTRTSSRAEVDALLDHLSVRGRSLRHAEAEELQRFYEELRLDMTYSAEERAVDVTIRPARSDSERVRGPSCPKTPPSHVPLTCDSINELRSLAGS